MSDYIVSARKYRPDSFEGLIGQDNIARTLKNSILRGQLAHAYLFCGPRGVGKTSTARIFAKTINCANPSADMEPCGECESCKSFAEGRSYCIYELDAASNNGIEDMKLLIDKVQIPPQVGRYSVYIIDEVHMLSQAAFNAFLKTLEEPPAHAIFILCTTEKHKIIPTILSRCQTYDFNRISVTDIVANLRAIASREGVNVDDESLHVIGQKADGAMRDALTIFDQTVAFCGTDIHYEDVIRNLNVLDYEYGFRLVDAFLAGDYATSFLILDEILAKGFNAIHFVSSVGSHLRDLLVSRTGGLDSLLDLPDSLKARYLKQANRCSVKFIYDALGIVSQCEAGYRAAVNQRLHIEFALMKLCFLSPASGLPLDRTIAEKAEGTVCAAEGPLTQLSGPAVAAGSPKATSAETKPKKGVNLSLSALMNESADVEKKKEENVIVEDALPADKKLEAVWKTLPAMYDEQPRMANLLANGTMVIKEVEGVKVVVLTVTNEVQKTWLQQNQQRKIEGILRKESGSSKVRLDIDVIPEEVREKKKYMPAEKARDLMEGSEEVRAFVAEFGLDIK